MNGRHLGSEPPKAQNWLGLALLNTQWQVVADTLLDLRPVGFPAAEDFRLTVLHDQIYITSYDLLAPLKKGDKRVALSVKMDQKGAYVNKLRQIRINSPHEALTLLKAGQHGLTTGATRLNPDSSRSHCLFTGC